MPWIRKVGLNVGSKPSRLLQPNGKKPNVPGRKKLGLPARKELQPHASEQPKKNTFKATTCSDYLIIDPCYPLFP